VRLLRGLVAGVDEARPVVVHPAVVGAGAVPADRVAVRVGVGALHEPLRIVDHPAHRARDAVDVDLRLAHEGDVPVRPFRDVRPVARRPVGREARGAAERVLQVLGGILPDGDGPVLHPRHADELARLADLDALHARGGHVGEEVGGGGGSPPGRVAARVDGDHEVAPDRHVLVRPRRRPARVRDQAVGVVAPVAGDPGAVDLTHRAADLATDVEVGESASRRLAGVPAVGGGAPVHHGARPVQDGEPPGRAGARARVRSRAARDAGGDVARPGPLEGAGAVHPDDPLRGGAVGDADGVVGPDRRTHRGRVGGDTPGRVGDEAVGARGVVVEQHRLDVRLADVVVDRAVGREGRVDGESHAEDRHDGECQVLLGSHGCFLTGLARRNAVCAKAAE
jgi:hypothetical protein